MQIKGFKVNKGLVKKIGSIVLAGAIAVGTYMMGYVNGTKDETNKILNGENEKITRIEELKSDLTSDLVSIMKARYQLLEEEETKKCYKLSDIYVLDTANDDFQTFGEASHYSYRYIFFKSEQVPTMDDYYYVLFADDYGYNYSNNNISPYNNSRFTEPGDYYIERVWAKRKEPMPHVEPLVYYLTDDEIQSSYTYEQLQMLFYRINSDELIQGQVLQNVK